MKGSYALLEPTLTANDNYKDNIDFRDIKETPKNILLSGYTHRLNA